ncbi:MAG: SURF1 family cytochrome oxidase biogenesis protein [Pseudomonadota bacterium]
MNLGVLKRLPLIPTIIVLAAAATMVALGIWQLGRAEEKMMQIILYSKSTALAEPAEFPLEGEGEDVWFRQSTLICESVQGIQPVAGTAETGAKGWAMRATCITASGGEALVDLGFSRELDLPDWSAGTVTGMIAPGPKLVARPAIAGLKPLARPDPSDLPNNHLAYAGQWFFFALTALVIYGIAVRKRLKP